MTKLDTPPYPELGATVAKYRRKANLAGSVMAMDKADRHAYADAIEKVIRSKQRAALQRETPTHNVSCASRTNHNTGEAIHKAMRAKQRAALLAAPGMIRRARTDREWQDMYAQAMYEKWKAN